MFTDPIADMLTRIRNASAVKKAEVLIPFSKVKWAIANILVQNGFVRNAEKTEDERGIKMGLKYVEGRPAISSLSRVSSPGRRVYVAKDNILSVRNGLGISVISTSQGIMDNKEAKHRKIGGELICEVY